MKRVIICGGTGFIGWHLAKRLHDDGCEVLCIDRKRAEFVPLPCHETTFDLRFLKENDSLFNGVDAVFQLACEVGGLGYIMDHDNDAEMLRNSALINLRVLEACRQQKIPKVFFASSACVYSSLPTVWLDPGTGKCKEYVARHVRSACKESDAPPFNPDNEYAYEKIFSERLYASYGRNHNMQVRIARLHNVFGPNGTWKGGREKAPAAICRKVAEVKEGGSIDIWGDGEQTRSFTYIDDTVEGIVRLMVSDFQGPVNIGSSEMVTVNQLVSLVCEIAGKKLTVDHIAGPVGVRGRNSDNFLIKEKLNWEPSIPLRTGLEQTYKWVSEQVDTARISV